LKFCNYFVNLAQGSRYFFEKARKIAKNSSIFQKSIMPGNPDLVVLCKFLVLYWNFCEFFFVFVVFCVVYRKSRINLKCFKFLEN
jgi:hypothetical protein